MLHSMADYISFGDQSTHPLKNPLTVGIKRKTL